jgi:dCMP deaminase
MCENDIKNKIDWDVRFLRIAAGEINEWSKDPSTKVSAVIFRDKYPIMSTYNGLPTGINDSSERLNNRQLKYKIVQHAEANAISACARFGIATEGLTMAVTHFPCSNCAGLIISAGIKKLIIQQPDEDYINRWNESIELSKEILNEAGIEIKIINLKEND